MVETLSFPRADWLSHTLPGVPWFDFEWLVQLVYLAVHAAAGCAGLIGLRAAVLFGTTLACVKTLRLQGAGPAAAGLGALWLGTAILPSADVRPDNFSVLFFSVVLLALEAQRLGRWRPRPRDLGWTAVLFCVWANMHLGFLLGLALIGLYAAGCGAEALRDSALGAPAQEARRRLRVLLAAAGTACLATLANPTGWAVYRVAFWHVSAMPFLESTILEWIPPLVTMRAFAPYWALMAAAYAAAFLHFGLTRRTPIAHVFCLVFLGWVSASSRRQVPYFALAALAVVFPVLLEACRGPRLKRGLQAAGALWFLLLAAQARQVAWLSWNLAPGMRWCAAAGARAAAFLLEERAELGGRPLYHGWSQGGYFGWALHPHYRVFYDGRYIFHGLLKETLEAVRSPAQWAGLMVGRGVEVAVLNRSFGAQVPRDGGSGPGPSSPRWRDYMPAGAWALVYEDDVNVVVVLRSAVDKAWLARAELKSRPPAPPAAKAPGPRHRAGRAGGG